MKNILKITFGILFITLLFSACEEYDDFMTGDAKTGGLIKPSAQLPYKLYNTPTLDIEIVVPKGEPIETIHVSYYYMRMSDTTMSNVLTFDIAVDGANKSDEIVKTVTYTWETLRAGIILPSNPQIPLETDPTISDFIGDYWLYSYEVTLADGRRLINNSTTQISVANFFAGKYDVTGYFYHPSAPRDINEAKDLVAKNSSTCVTTFGDFADKTWLIEISIDNSYNVTMAFPDDGYGSQQGDPTDPSHLCTYDPETGVIELWYYYYGSTGLRMAHEIYTPQ